MRLLNTSTIQFREFHGNQIPYYAILSHTWGAEEVSFDEMQDGKGKDKAGYKKIADCCALAASDGWDYVWIDTCCINKSSSAELTEAINSMFQWYRKAQVCYAYLADVPSGWKSYHTVNPAVRRSRWFTRGWTLQELLAPATVIFLNESWVEIGTKSSFSELISSATGIARSDMANFRDANVAVKMSWAANRETTRTEDIAYCLMGLFGVNMPLLYGEGRNAFIRLQLEILKMSDDETIFAWEGETASNPGLLALSPASFRNCESIRRTIFDKERPEYSMTNKGLRMGLLLWKGTATKTGDCQESGDEVYVAPLNCTRVPSGHPVAIHLKKDEASKVGVANGFTRYSPRSGASLVTVELTKNLNHNTSRISGPTYQTFPLEPGRPVSYADGSTYVFEPVLRHTVYVKQLDIYPDSRLNYRPRRFSIRYPARNITISEVRLRSGLASWEEGEPGESGIWLDSADEAAVLMFRIFYNRYWEESFAVLLRKLPDDSAGVDIAIPETYQGLSEVLDLFKEQMSEGLRTDRITKSLNTGVAVSAALRPRAVSGEKQFLVDISFDTGRPGRLTDLATGQEAAKAIGHQECKILDQIRGYAPLRPSPQIGQGGNMNAILMPEKELGPWLSSRQSTQIETNFELSTLSCQRAEVT